MGHGLPRALGMVVATLREQHLPQVLPPLRDPSSSQLAVTCPAGIAINATPGYLQPRG